MTQTAFKAFGGAVAVISVLGGCASPPMWSHPSKTEGAQEVDLRRCEREAERVALEASGQTRGDLAGRTGEATDPMSLKDRQLTARLFEARRDACMAALGYLKDRS